MEMAPLARFTAAVAGVENVRMTSGCSATSSRASASACVPASVEAIVDADVLAFDPVEGSEAREECSNPDLAFGIVLGGRDQHTDPPCMSGKEHS
jgi:hypothetical protein